MEEILNKDYELTNEDLKLHTKNIKCYSTLIRKNYYRIANELCEIEKTECYLDDGFEDVVDYARKVLGIQKTTTYNLLSIGKDFINTTGDRSILTDSGRDYTVSQLQVLLPLGKDKMKELHNEGIINPDQSVRTIKRIIKEKNEPGTEKEHEPDVNYDTFGHIDLLKDGTIIPYGDIPDTFILQLLEVYKDTFEDFLLMGGIENDKRRSD